MAEAVAAPLGVVVFGVSTPFAYWGFGLVRDLVNEATGATLHLHLSSFQELREGFERRGGGSVVVTSDYPDADLLNFLIPSALPLIVFGDAADEMIAWTAHSRRMTAENAARFCSNVVSAVMPAFCAPRALVIRANAQVSTIVENIVAYLFPNADGDLAATLFDALVGAGKLSPDGVEDWRAKIENPETEPTGVDGERRAKMVEALASYDTICRDRGACEVIWPVALFTRPDSKDWRDPIDLMGPARAVLYGPYLHLPAGSWTTRVEFEIDKAFSGVEASTDVFISEVLVEKVFFMPSKGIFSFELAFTVTDPRHPVEIRLFTKRSAIEGLLLVRSVTVRPGAPE